MESAHGAYTVKFDTVYRRPIVLPQIVVVRGRVVKIEGRKIYACGTVEGGDGELIRPPPTRINTCPLPSSPAVKEVPILTDRLGTGFIFAEADGTWIKSETNVGRSQL